MFAAVQRPSPLLHDLRQEILEEAGRPAATVQGGRADPGRRHAPRDRRRAFGTRDARAGHVRLDLPARGADDGRP
ncbi:hypothetical protein, partial [Rhodovulum sulfidophilum]|uniref:hypothetical protein n=1 Tax=Rhodovulum sulfidophilum TaxID=35806 RepID=UPI001F3BC005